jgi:hypothetical protein
MGFLNDLDFEPNIDFAFGIPTPPGEDDHVVGGETCLAVGKDLDDTYSPPSTPPVEESDLDEDFDFLERARELLSGLNTRPNSQSGLGPLDEEDEGDAYDYGTRHEFRPLKKCDTKLINAFTVNNEVSCRKSVVMIH